MFGVVARLRPTYWCFEDVVQVQKHLPPPAVAGVPYRTATIDARLYQPQRRKRLYVGDFPQPIPPATVRPLADCWRPGPYAIEPDMDQYAAVSINGRINGRLGKDRVRVIEPTDTYAPTVISTVERGSRQRRGHYRRLPDGGIVRLAWQELAALQGWSRLVDAKRPGRRC